MALNRDEPPVGKEFQKERKEEDFLKHFNQILQPHHDEEYAELEETMPTLHVIGVPRSGTTLMTQLLATSLDIGYINNLIATFWSAPLYGIRLSKKLIDQPTSNFSATYGRTSGITEPHEFGYFWSKLLDYRNMVQKTPEEAARIDWNHVAKVLNNINQQFGKPTVYKSFLVGWHIREIQQVMPKSLFIYLKRDPIQNAISIYEMRMNLFGTADVWNSLLPQEHEALKALSIPEQVAGQVHFVNKALREQVEMAAPGTVVEVSYEELCEHPGREIEKIKQLALSHGHEFHDDVELPGFKARLKDIDSNPIYQEIAAATRKFAGNSHV